MPSWATSQRDLPTTPACAVCSAFLAEPFGWCGGCREAYCFRCGRAYYCTPSCPGNGCLPGLCVRVVEGGRLSERWGVPEECPLGPQVVGRGDD